MAVTVRRNWDSDNNNLIDASSVETGAGSPLTSKGDIYTYDTGNQRLPVGSDGQILSANSATATGLEWIANGGSAEGARIQLNAAQSIPNNALTIITFDTEVYDDNDYIDIGGNATRITVPSDGDYLFVVYAQFDTSATGYRQVRLLKNGATSLEPQRINPISSTLTAFTATFTVRLVTSDYVELQVFQDSGGPLNFSGPTPGLQAYVVVNPLVTGSGGGGSGGGRETLTANRTYFVDPAGSDANDGLTVGTPFLTIQKAVDTVISVDPLEFEMNIQLADGTYDTQTTIELKKHLQGTPVIIQGNGANKNLVIIDDSNVTSSISTFSSITSRWTLQDLTLTNSAAATGGGNYCLEVRDSGVVRLDNVRLLAGSASNRGLFAINNSTIIIRNGLEVEGTFGSFGLVCARSSGVDMEGITITFTSSPSFSTWILLRSCAFIDQKSITQVNTLTATRYDAEGCSTIRTDGATDTDVPGNAAGSLGGGATLSF